MRGTKFAVSTFWTIFDWYEICRGQQKTCRYGSCSVRVLAAAAGGGHKKSPWRGNQGQVKEERERLAFSLAFCLFGFRLGLFLHWARREISEPVCERFRVVRLSSQPVQNVFWIQFARLDTLSELAGLDDLHGF